MEARARHIGPGEGGRSRVFASELEVKAGRDDGLSFGMFRSTFPPGGGMPFLHLHRTYEEAFYLIQGEVEFYIGDEEMRRRTRQRRAHTPGHPALLPQRRRGRRGLDRDHDSTGGGPVDRGGGLDRPR